VKKLVSGISFLTLIVLTGSAFAGTNAIALTPNNGKDQSSITQGKESNKYSFTLFNFFNETKEESKVDSTATEPKLVDPVIKKPVN
jgi:hypothetical protein